MDDPFESFIKENREGFDYRDPDPVLWSGIEKRIRPRKTRVWRPVLQKAAIVALIFAASFAANEMLHRVRNSGRAELNKDTEQGTKIPGLEEAEAYYAGLVKQKMDELKPIISNCPWLGDELNTDMSELDSVYADLRKDLNDNLSNQAVIEAIIENYRLRIRILEDLLTDVRSHEGECLTETGRYAL